MKVKYLNYLNCIDCPHYLGTDKKGECFEGGYTQISSQFANFLNDPTNEWFCNAHPQAGVKE